MPSRIFCCSCTCVSAVSYRRTLGRAHIDGCHRHRRPLWIGSFLELQGLGCIIYSYTPGNPPTSLSYLLICNQPASGPPMLMRLCLCPCGRAHINCRPTAIVLAAPYFGSPLNVLVNVLLPLALVPTRVPSPSSVSFVLIFCCVATLQYTSTYFSPTRQLSFLPTMSCPVQWNHVAITPPLPVSESAFSLLRHPRLALTDRRARWIATILLHHTLQAQTP